MDVNFIVNASDAIRIKTKDSGVVELLIFFSFDGKGDVVNEEDLCLPLPRFLLQRLYVFPFPALVVARMLIDSWRCHAPCALNRVV